MKRVRLTRPSPALVVALLALFVAMGGVGYAALKLPRNSVGSKQIKPNAVKTSKVADGSLLAGDFKAGQLPAGAQGARGLRGTQGVKGVACSATDPACKGPKGDKGDTGLRGPGTTTINLQVVRDGTSRHIATIGGMHITAACGTVADPFALINVVESDGAHEMYGWGTETSTTAVNPARNLVDGNNEPIGYSAFATGTKVQFDLVATSNVSGSGLPVKYTHLLMDVLAAGGCNFHGLIIPPS